MRPGQRRRFAALPLALIALLTAMPISSANATGMKAAVVEVPSSSLTGVLSGVPVSSLGLSNAEVGTLLGGLDGGVLGTQTSTLTTLVGSLLAGNPNATLGELTKKVQENPVLALLLAGKSLTPEKIVLGLSPEQLSTLLANFTEGANAAKVEQVLASLAAGGSLGGEEALALKSILTGLTGALSGEGLSKLREDLAGLPTGLSSGELAALDPAHLAAVVDGLFATATPTQLQPVVADLLGSLSWGTGTTGTLAQTLGVPLETLAGALGETAKGSFSTLPVVSGAVGSSGQVMGLVDRARGLALGLLGPEGESGGSGGGGAGKGGGGGSGGNGAGGGSGGSGVGGSSGGGTPGGGLTLTVTLPGSTPASAAGSRGTSPKTLAKLKLVSWRRRGRVARIVLQAPGAGTLKLTGRGIRSTTVHLRQGGRVTLTATLSRASMAALQHGHRHLKVRLQATFTPTKGTSSKVTAVIPFA
ncbi:MAG TPA: hypothetical protein VGY76_02675 [Solirubrobacteraceae bacterium]|jgi:hypothetical protein|nr:hypothetical protein [Solirubrobacteraceae bacterium]